MSIIKYSKDINIDVVLGIDKIRNYNKIIKYGIPQDTAKRNDSQASKKTKLNNAEILYILEHGSQVRNLPARPLLESVLEKHWEQITVILNKAVDYLWDGKDDLATAQLDLIALRMQKWLYQYFHDNEWEPNAYSTLKAKYNKYKKWAKKPVSFEEFSSKNVTLIDTGEMRSALRAVVMDDV